MTCESVVCANTSSHLVRGPRAGGRHTCKHSVSVRALEAKQAVTRRVLPAPGTNEGTCHMRKQLAYLQSPSACACACCTWMHSGCVLALGRSAGRCEVSAGICISRASKHICVCSLWYVLCRQSDDNCRHKRRVLGNKRRAQTMSFSYKLVHLCVQMRPTCKSTRTLCIHLIAMCRQYTTYSALQLNS